MLASITDVEKKQLAANPVAATFKPQEEHEEIATKNVEHLMTPGANASNKVKKNAMF